MDDIKRKILLILTADGNTVNREVLSRVLSHARYLVEIVDDEDKAMHSLMDNEYDIVVFDTNMRDAGKLAIIQEYKMLFPASMLPFILITDDITQDANFASHENGPIRIITKPLKVEAFVSTLADVISDTNSSSIKSEPNPVMPPEVARWIDDTTICSLRKLSNGDTRFLKTLYDNYIADAGCLITRMDISVIAHQYEDLVDIAHTLKDSSSYIGARIICQRCSELSGLSVSEICERGGDIVKQISETFSHIRSQLFDALCVDLDSGCHEQEDAS